MNQTTTSRLYFLDWIRVLAFFLLIFYHTGMYYVTWDWHVKSPFASDTIEPLMMLSSPWRLDLLFLVSGVASSFMLKKMRPAPFLRLRTVRLLVPLVFGMFVIVPLQPYLEVMEKVGYTGSYLDFMQLYIRAYHGFCRGNDCLILPTWNHLWFVAYLWIYTLALGALASVFGDKFDAWADRLAKLLTDWKMMVLPIAVLAVVRVLLVARFPANHAVVGDWFNHATYFPLFALGVLLARRAAPWATMDALRWPALGAAFLSWAYVVYINALPDSEVAMQYIDIIRTVSRTIYATCAWSSIVAACGFAHRHMNFDSARLRYFTQAVFPVYILHQTIIVGLAHYIKPAKIPPVLEGCMLVGVTFVLCFAGFELVRRVAVLRPLFGLGDKATPARTAGIPQTSAVSASLAA